MHAQYTAKTIARFWAKVDTSGDCWIWTAGHDRAGYGRFYVAERDNNVAAHRFVYELTYGALAAELVVRHSCDTPACVNPAHLLSGTTADNNADTISRGRANPPRGDQHWSRRTGANVPRGERQPHARMSADQVRDMRQRYANGATLNELVAAFGLSKTAVHQIVHYQRWRHVT